MLCMLSQTKLKEVEMESNTQAGLVFDVESLYADFRGVSDKRKPRGLRYSLAMILVLIMLAKACGENQPSGIAEWAQHRSGILVDLLRIRRETMPADSTYRRILAEVVDVEELE
jgi:hypothetical protein